MVSPIESTDAIIDRLLTIVLENPDEGERVAREYGLWGAICAVLHKPLLLDTCRQDVNAFIEYTIEDPETGQPVEQQDFHQEWQVLIDEKRRVLIVAPRGHGKSSQIAGRVVWEIGHNHNIRIKIIGSTDEKAKEILGLVKSMIKNSPKVHDVFPDIEIDEDRGDTKGAFFVKRSNVAMRDATCEAAGVLSAGAGGRADILICDDIVDMKNSVINPTMREQVTRTVKETWFSLVAANGQIIWISTPYHILDATHNLKNESGDLWTVWWKPAIEYILQFDQHGQPIMEDDPEQPGKQKQVVVKKFLWPTKWSEAKLDDKRVELGERSFARQYLLNAMSDEERTFPETSLAKSYNYSLSYIGEGIEDDWASFAGIDLASAFGKRAAWTVIVTLARNPANGRLRFKEIVRKKQGFSKTIEDVVSGFKRHRWCVIHVETNQYQSAVVDALDNNYKTIPVKGFQTGLNKHDESVGLPGLALAFERALFEIPAARLPLSPEDTSDLACLMNELSNYPGGEFKDIVMALWFAYRAAVETTGDFVEGYLQAMEMM